MRGAIARPLILTDADLVGPDVMPAAIAAIEEALRARRRGELVAPPRHHVSFPGGGDLVFTVGGTSGRQAVAGFRVYDTFPGARHDQIVAVWSASDAILRGLVIGERLGAIRTGAIGGVAIRAMSREDAGDVAVIGSGLQARTQLEAAAAVRPLRRIRVHSRRMESRQAFASEMGRVVGRQIEAASSVREAVEGADIVLCATSSGTPVMSADWLAPGCHVNTVGPKAKTAHELGLDVADRAALIATDSPDQLRAYQEPFFLAGTPHGDRIADLATVVGDRRRSRVDADITLFCSVGLAGTEVIVASRLIAVRKS